MAEETKKEAHVVPGAQTFGKETAKARGGKRRARAYWLRDQAENRLLVLLERGEEADRLACPFPEINWRDIRRLHDGAKFARLPDGTKLLILRGERWSLERELANLMASGNLAKQRMLAPTIARQIEEISESIGYLADESGEPDGNRK